MTIVGCDLYVDCFAGAAGDMLLGALLDLGVPRDVVESAIDALRLQGVKLDVREVRRGALVGKKVDVLVHGHAAGDAHGPVHGHAHTHYSGIRTLVTERSRPEVARRALEIFDRIAAVEARRHGVPVGEVAFHELGAADSIADIVGIAAALAWLSPASVTSRPIPLGGGTVKTAHGILPVPAPATLELLVGCEVEAGGTSELTTPTGAAVLSVLANRFGPLPQGRLSSVGWGAGMRELADRPNLLRLVAFHRSSAADEVELLEANLDDMTPELVAPLVEALMGQGALDAWITPITMKKGRPGFLVSALCRGDQREALEALLFAESTTLGVRWSRRARTVLDRAIVDVETRYGTIAIKVAGRGLDEGRFREIVTVAPEFEACRRVAADRGVPLRKVHEAALVAAADLQKADIVSIVNDGAQSGSAPPAVLVAGGDAGLRDAYVAELAADGVVARAVESVAPLADEEGGTVMLLAGGLSARRDGAGALLDAIGDAKKARASSSLVACLPREAADAVSAAFASGADDVLFTPPAPGELVARIRAAQAYAAVRSGAAQASRYGEALLAAGALIRKDTDLEEALSDWLQRVCDSVALDRAILLLCTDDDGGALLVGASDDATLNRVPLDLDRYPEVKASLESRTEVIIEDARNSELLGAWADLAAEKGGEAIVTLPILDGDRAVGALLLRSSQPHPTLSPQALEFLRSAAAMLALLLRVSGALASVREQTRRTSLARHESERRSEAIARSRDFLASAPDCTIVVDPDGTALYLNRAAEQLTGFRREGLEGGSIATLVEPADRAELVSRVRAAANGEAALDWFDLALHTTSGERLIVSASTSSALSDVGAAIVTFRDVTVPRQLEAELQKSNEFLERLIDSTVDGIVASDLRGRVILFNKGAARLTGWTAEEVVRKVPVWHLYPRGQAQTIMRALRSESSGQRGRLEPSRMEVVARDGTLVPVSLTASLVYEGDREVAIVGVVSDLREQLRIEESLAQAQEKLILSERQAAIAELAGTTAHELNQPLTSVMGYSELLRRRMGPNDPHFRAVDTILREAERMAEIVRKIGRITKYETKNYVGSTNIIDLEKSTHDG